MIKKINLQKIILTLLALTLVWGLTLSLARAETRQGDRVTVGSEEVIEDDLFIAGGDIDIGGVVNGDVYVGGQSLAVTGDINGDLFVGAETIIITGTVTDDINGAGRSLVLDGATVSDGVMFFGESLHIESDTEVLGSVIFLGSELVLDGVVGGSVRGAMQTATINGQVGGGVYLEVEGLSVGDSANIARNLEYKSVEDATISGSAIIAGEVVKEVPAPLGSSLPLWVWAYISTFIVGVVLLVMFPRPTVALSNRIASYPLRSLVVGLIVAIIAVPVAAIVAFTVVGLPLALILLALFLISIYSAQVFTAIALGRFILGNINKNKPEVNPHLALSLGLLLLYLLFMLPMVGIAIQAMVTFFGLGAVVYGLRRARTL